MNLQHIVPWGRSFDEYVRMFALTPADLARPILGCGDGPAGFNAVLTGQRGHVISADPIYRYGGAEIRQRIEETAKEVMAGVRQHPERYVWTTIPDPETLYQLRMSAMETFLEDYEAGRQEGRYMDESLPALTFSDSAFDLALSSHLLFTYSDHVDSDFHLAALLELLRVAPEVRIFPLVTLDGRPSEHLGPVLERLGRAGHSASIEHVDYAFQHGGDQMLRILRHP